MMREMKIILGKEILGGKSKEILVRVGEGNIPG